LFGLLAYLAMVVMSILPLVIDAKTNKKLHNQAQDLTWNGLFLGGTAMAVFSGYLMYLLAVVIKAPCPYCIASAIFATVIFVLVLIGREWEQMGSMITNGLIAGFLTLLVTFGIYSSAGVSVTADSPTSAEVTSLAPTGAPAQPYGWTVTTQSGASETALAEHLKKTGAKMYGGWFCSHCYEQKQLFGREAKASINYIECHPQGKDPQVDLCRKESIEGFPTWDIAGKKYPGTQPPEQLAKLSGYTGPQNFRYSKLIPGFSAKPAAAEASGKPESSPQPAASDSSTKK
jgi:Vitamin K epoxide reductase family